MDFDRAIYSKNIINHDNTFEGCLLIKNGKIIDITSYDKLEDTDLIEDYSDYAILPGIIDTHVHVNEPGRTDWEGFETATKAGVKGGITSLIDMPLNCTPVTVNRKSLHQKITEMTDKIYCNVGFYGGIIPQSMDEIQELNEDGVFGYKIFLIDSGIDEFPQIPIDKLELIMQEVSELNSTLLIHAELKDETEINGDPTKYNTYLKSRPRKWENQAIKIILDLSDKTNCKVHILHLSSSDQIELIKNAKDNGVNVTVETCPHYLYFNSEDIDDGQTQFKCAPPIREEANRQKLWKAVKDDVIDLIVSDHSPSPPSLKDIENGNFLTAWGGISSLQFTLSIILTEAKKHDISINDIVRLMSYNPSKFLGIHNNKGKIAQGYDADLIIVDLEKQFLVKEDIIEHKHKLTPYLDEYLKGEVIKTFVDGKVVYDQENQKFDIPDSVLLRKEKRK